MYREHEYVERCFCDEPATRPCGCCGRARCERHLERDLCNRCSQFVARELGASSWTPWILGGVVGTVTTVALLAAGVLGSVAVGGPLGIAAGLGYRALRRKRLIRALGPTMSASRGELPAPPREPARDDFYVGSRNNDPPPGGG